MPILVHGVDISALEGWMIKINSNPSVFGKNTSRRWFCVSIDPAGSTEQLILSYSTAKNSKEPRGWLYLQDVSGVYCRRDIIEVVSPSRTLRFKGETTVEHRLWSESLHALCNPPKPSPSVELPQRAESISPPSTHGRDRHDHHHEDSRADTKKESELKPPKREEKLGQEPPRSSPRRQSPSPDRRRSPSPSQSRDRHQQQPHSNARSHGGSDSDSDQDGSEYDRREDREGSSEEEESPRQRRSANAPTSPRGQEGPQRRSSLNDRRDSMNREVNEERPRSRRQGRESDSGSGSDHDDCDDDSRLRDDRNRGRRQNHAREQASDSDSDSDSDRDRDDRHANGDRGARSSMERRPSLLVASIKSMSPCALADDAPRSRKASVTSAQQSKEQERPYAKSPREKDAEERTAGLLTFTPTPTCEPEQNRRMPTPEPEQMKPKKHSDYFDEDEDEDEGEDSEQEEKTLNEKGRSVGRVEVEVATGGVRPDNNFADDDWDEADAPAPLPSKAAVRNRESPEKASVQRSSPGFGGVTADSNFATDDWDD